MHLTAPQRRPAAIDSALVRRLAPIAVLLPLLLAAAGCSTYKPGEKVVTPTPDTVVGTVATAPTATVPAVYKNGDPTAGKAVFLAPAAAAATR